MKKHIITLVAIFLLAALAFSAVSCGKEDNGEIPSGMKLVSDTSVVDYKLFAPSEWIVDISSGYYTLRANNFSKVSLSVNCDTDSDKTDLTEYWAEYKTSLEAMFDKKDGATTVKYEKNEGESLTFKKADKNIAAKKYVYTATLSGTEMKYMQVICSSSEGMLIITFAGPAAQFDDYTDDYGSILKEFTFVK